MQVIIPALEMLGLVIGVGLIFTGFWIIGAIVVGITLAVQDRRLGIH